MRFAAGYLCLAFVLGNRRRGPSGLIGGHGRFLPHPGMRQRKFRVPAE